MIVYDIFSADVLSPVEEHIGYTMTYAKEAELVPVRYPFRDQITISSAWIVCQVPRMVERFQ